MNVAVLGASDRPERYSYKAVRLLKGKGHAVFPVHPTLRTIHNLPVFASLREIPVPLDVVSVYLSFARQARIEEELLRSRPRRVIFNPGAENPALAERLRAAGIEALNACTLVLLNTGQFAL